MVMRRGRRKQRRPVLLLLPVPLVTALPASALGARAAPSSPSSALPICESAVARLVADDEALMVVDAALSCAPPHPAAAAAACSPAASYRRKWTWSRASTASA